MSERMRHKFCALGVVAALAALLGACGSGGNPAKSSAGPPAATSAAASSGQAELDAAVAAAKKEKVTVVGHPGPQYDGVIQAFQKAYPDIPIEYNGDRPSTFTPKMLTEQKNGVYNWDVWWDATSQMNTVALPAGAFSDLTPYLILPEVKDPTNWRGGKVLFTSDKNPAIFVYRLDAPGGPYVNRDLLPKDLFPSGQPLNLDQLLDPRLKGKILFRTPSTPEGGALFLTGVLKAKGPDFVKKLLIDQQPIFEENAQLISQQLIQGKAPIEIGGDQPTLTDCKVQGGCKNIEEVPQHSYALSNGVGVFKNAPHPNATKVFVNWILSKAGQQASVDSYVKAKADGANSDRVDIEPKDPEHAVDFNNLSQLSLQGTDAGNDDMTAVLALYKQISSK
jgi:ABC-type Fe3+ transport system substrate-binding protein